MIMEDYLREIIAELSPPVHEASQALFKSIDARKFYGNGPRSRLFSLWNHQMITSFPDLMEPAHHSMVQHDMLQQALWDALTQFYVEHDNASEEIAELKKRRQLLEHYSMNPDLLGNTSPPPLHPEIAQVFSASVRLREQAWFYGFKPFRWHQGLTDFVSEYSRILDGFLSNM